MIEGEIMRRRHRVPRMWLPTGFQLSWQARRDRRAGLPVGLSAATTPALQAIAARFGAACERERSRYLADTRLTTLGLAAMDTEIGTLRFALRRYDEEVTRLSEPPPGSWIGVRFPGEERLSTSAAEHRRLVHHWNAARAAKARVEETQRRLDAALVERAHLAAQKEARADVARSRVLRFARIADRKAAVYRRVLLTRHPQRDQLAGAWTTELCPIPAWVALDDPLPTAHESGAAA